MKNSTSNKEKRNVPSIHPGCSMAETGRTEHDDYNNPLESLNIIPEGKGLVQKEVKPYKYDGDEYTDVKYSLPKEIKDPSNVRQEPLIKVVVPSGVHPIAFLKEKGVDITKAWVFMHEEVVETLRKLPCRFHQKTVAYGEFFRFEDLDTISLQTVKYFDNWQVLLDWEFNGKKFVRIDKPECIIEVCVTA